MKKLLIVITIFVAQFTVLTGSGVPAHAEDKPYIAVGTAKTKKSVIAFDSIRADATLTAPAKTIADTVKNDLDFMDLLRFLDPGAFIESKSAGIGPNTFKMSDWTSIGVEFLIKSSLITEAGTIKYQAHLYDTFGSKELISKRYIGPVSEAKLIAHTFANDVITALTGLPGIFSTKIVMSCDRGTRKKELYLMNFDGTEVKQITQHNSIAFAPAWSPDNTKIVYSLYARHASNIRNIDLYQLDFNTNTIRLLSNRRGINSGAAFAPDGRNIALTMSFLGNPEIFLLDPAAQNVTRVTKSFGVDVDPSWSPDGRKIAFVSSRSGMPMVYSMDSTGDNVQRLTYAGRYNATPSWSPTNNKIAFAGWIDGRFDIFMMNPDGTKIERLTKSQGNNEDPSFSPDGNFIVFSSNRTGQKNIYVMNIDGSFVKRLTFGLGNCVSPKWSSNIAKK